MADEVTSGDVLQALDAQAASAMRVWQSRREPATIVIAPPAEAWPFTYPLVPNLPSGAVVVWMPGLHEAFVNQQAAGTRLVTTQPAMLMQTWIDATASRDDVMCVATADAASLARHAPDAAAGRGPFASPRVVLSALADSMPPWNGDAILPRAFRAPDPVERLRLCIDALDAERSAPHLLAAASACMEVNDLDRAAQLLAEAVALAPAWVAVHFEQGKSWLRLEEMERASRSFQTAAELMPGFGAAWGNLGATLGELDRPDAALAAFQHALAADPDSHQALNNIGVVSRELGRLPESEAAFRRVIELAPELAFGYYNLGHTLFLQGRYQAALTAYIEGQTRDPERNPVQASRLALCRLATGDANGAVKELQNATGHLPSDYKRQLLADTDAIAWALLTHRPDLPGWATVHDWLTRELARR